MNFFPIVKIMNFLPIVRIINFFAHCENYKFFAHCKNYEFFAHCENIEFNIIKGAMSRTARLLSHHTFGVKKTLNQAYSNKSHYV